MMLLPVIMAGGSGSRLWPMSRTFYPKQFLTLFGEQSMLQSTIHRLKGLEHESPLVICNEEHRFIVAEQLRQGAYEHSGILLEPAGRNTAPAIALAAIHALKKNEDALLLVLAADHVILDTPAFCESIERAIPLAEKGKLVTFGIVPSHPETGYGYIKAGKAVGDFSSLVDAFVEKPNLEKAKEYVDSQQYLWNSGMFLFKASRYLAELEKFRPDILESCQLALEHIDHDLDFIRVDKDAFLSCPDESVDYAVMEKTHEAVVVPMDAKWSDVGSWSAIWEISDKDKNQNVIKGDVLVDDSQGCYINSQSKLIATVGVNNLVVIETKDAVLVANKDTVQDVKNIVGQLKEFNRTEHLQHREVYRPWGSHDAIAEGRRFHVKRVTIKPGERTARQIHFNRAEHWIVVSGTARVRKGDDEILLAENQSIYIPIGISHSMENPGKVPLVVIEVRSGDYLGEDDVIRLEEYRAGY